MIIQSILFYTFISSVVLIYGVGACSLMTYNHNFFHSVIDFCKTLIVVIVSIIITWTINFLFLAPYHAAILFPFFAFLSTFFITIFFDITLNKLITFQKYNFQTAFLIVVVSLSESSGFLQSIIIGVISVASFYILLPFLFGIRKRMQNIQIASDFKNSLEFITLALIILGLYGICTSWLRMDIFL